MIKFFQSTSTKLFIVLILVLLLFRLMFMPYVVNGESMYPTLNNGDLGLGIKTNFCDINRFDVVVVDTTDKYLIKRVIGLPGETIKYENNILVINDEIVKDDYGVGNTTNFEIKLKENEYFCMGDNREHSSDSRSLGPFNIKIIKGKSIFNP